MRRALLVFSVAAVAELALAGIVLEKPSSVSRTDDGWRIVYALGEPVKADFFALENNPAGAWKLTVDSWEFAHGEGLCKNLVTNLGEHRVV